MPLSNPSKTPILASGTLMSQTLHLANMEGGGGGGRKQEGTSVAQPVPQDRVLTILRMDIQSPRRETRLGLCSDPGD